MTIHHRDRSHWWGCEMLNDFERTRLREIQQDLATDDPELVRTFETMLHGKPGDRAGGPRGSVRTSPTASKAAAGPAGQPHRRGRGGMAILLVLVLGILFGLLGQIGVAFILITTSGMLLTWWVCPLTDDAPPPPRG